VAVTENLPALPFGRSHVLEIAPLYLALLQGDQAIRRVRTPAGDEGWLVLRHEEIRTLLANADLGRTHADRERAARFTDAAIVGGPMEGDPETEKADHNRLRMVQNRSFSVRRMEALRPRVQAIVDDLLDDLTARTPPADLHEAFSFPLPVLVICELLGVPYEDRGRFRTWSDGAVVLDDREAAMASLQELNEYISGLVARRRREGRGEDVISDLIQAADDEGRLSEDEIVMLAGGLLFAGHETTVARIDLGALLLLTHPEQRELLQRDPSLAPSAVEEILRFSTTTIGIAPRYALADIEIAGVTIRTGDLVLLALDAGNRDERAFADPGRFDITRERNPHVSFGHGFRFCLGAPLARVELQTVFGTLFRRLPDLQLAVPAERIRERSHLLTGGVEELPVTW
jgi:pentalenolactone synthase